MEDLLDVLFGCGFVCLFILAGAVTYIRTERRHHERWAEFDHMIELEPEQPPRARAPKSIRRLALWSIYMGQMSIPGGLVGLIGLAAAGLGLAAIPGMILAIRIWRLGFWLLDRDPRAEREARSLATFAIILNIVAIAIGLMVAIGLGDAEAWMLPVVLIVYGAVSFAHAYAMRDCADLLAHAASDDEALALSEPIDHDLEQGLKRGPRRARTPASKPRPRRRSRGY